MTESYQKLIAILKEMFQLDQSDLDFGIYRIMNYKRNEIEKFLNEDLLPQVKTELEKYISVEQKGIGKELKELKGKLVDAGVALESSSKYVALKSKLDNGLNVTSAENEVYSHLANFFRRYYSEGDFISLRRYKKDVYAMPYEGEEVKLHWANADQYYIKTAEFFRDYTFTTPDDKKVHFKLIDAETEKDNNKTPSGKERRFVLLEETPCAMENGELFIYFQYKVSESKQKDIISKTIEIVSEIISNDEVYRSYQSILAITNDKGNKSTLLEKHLNDYTARNTFDYFIHKDLGGFLKRELNFYIKNEIMFLDDIDVESKINVEQYIAKVKVVKEIGHKIITFLEQIENFQKRLWLKKKFVVESNYCITLDKIDNSFYNEIISNTKQQEEWEKMYAIDELEGYTVPLTVEFLENNPFLIVDTALFDDTFKEKIISTMYNIDENLDGILINSENFQALNLIQNRYKTKAKMVYIDPPYNTSENSFVYKNNYKHSSWNTMMLNRLSLSKGLIEKSGVICAAIDDTEVHYLRSILDLVFGESNRIATIGIEVNPAGQNLRPNAPALSHDYSLIYANSINDMKMLLRGLSEEEKKAYKEEDDKGKYLWDNLRRRGGNSRPTDRPNQWYPLYVNVEKKIVSLKPFDGSQEIWPIDPQGEKRIWRLNPDGAKRDIANGELSVLIKNGRIEIVKKTRMPEGKKPKTLWYDSKYSATTYGSKLLKDILGGQYFSYPKSLHLVQDTLTHWLTPEGTVIDFFAGSGTTGHAVINQNREDGGRRKYILIEMGNYFDTVTKPRIQKVIYSNQWKNGKPVTRKGSSHIFKYIRLESYEDTLNNLVINLTQEQLSFLEKNPELREQYMLTYMLNSETEKSMSLLNIDMFKNPFEYKLKIANGLETQVTTIDLIETFNYLLGIEVIRNERKERYNVIEDNSSEVPGEVKLSSSKDGEYTFKEIEGRTLDGDKILVIWRTLSDDIVKDNAALDAYFLKKKYSTQDFEFNRIYVNSDNNLQNLKLDEERWKVVLIEEEFKKLMFNVQDV
ncbi:site-specific DNA-methyltransferase [Bacillus inaquosorum]